jgi:hypothetical protein
MGSQAPIADVFFAELDKLGVAKVREQLAVGTWGKSGRKVKLAKLWLEDQDRAAAHRSATEHSADTAEAAYALARDANFRAALALAVAAALLIVQVALALLRPA